ncbi:hypothetical protein F5Y19DRAFT_490257 [Xylariaceae sp. FL1651]|nr:hypothetical protein F5Y19DRAFT_490257 [Xylariaceae sp. FL1651]
MEFPRRHPKYYNDPFANNEVIDMPQDGDDLDRLFISESTQKSSFFGIRTWQATSLNRWVQFSSTAGLVSGGSVSTDDRTRANARMLVKAFEDNIIRVNEANWLPFLRRDRWFDLIGQRTRPMVPVARGGPWSIDNPKVWNVLRISIELADRMLKAMVRDRHAGLETLLFGRLEYWKNVRPGTEPYREAKVLLSSAKEVELATAQGRTWTNPWAIPAANRERYWLDTMARYSQEQHWGFMPEHDPGREWGVCWTDYGRPPYAGPITLTTEGIRHIYEGDITLAERCLVQFNLTVAIIHEYSHAVMFYRMHDRSVPAGVNMLWSDPSIRTDVNLEPFVNFEAIAEVGMAMEARIFGGTVNLCPAVNSYPITCLLHHWPWAEVASGGADFMNMNDPVYNRGAAITTERLTPLQASRLLSAEFWDAPMPAAKSDFFFHRVGMFRSESTNDPPAYRLAGPGEWADVVVDESRRARWGPGDAAIVDAWNARQREWNGYRMDWFDLHRNLWLTTPWCHTFFRSIVEDFKHLFEEKQEVGAFRCAQTMGAGSRPSTVMWDSHTAFMDALPTPTSRPIEWVYFLIALLMNAAMPIRTTRVRIRDTRPEATQQFVLTPSVDAEPALRRNRPNDPLKYYHVIDPPTPRNKRREPNTLYNPLDPAQSGVQSAQMSQLGYLRLVYNVMQVIIARRGIVPLPWVTEIHRVLIMLRNDRLQIRAANPQDHLARWATDWDFHIPTYNHQDLGWAQHDPATNKWAAVP